MKPAYTYDEDENLFVGPGERHFNTPPEIVAEFNELHADIESRRVSYCALADVFRELETALRRVADRDNGMNEVERSAVAGNALAVIESRRRKTTNPEGARHG